MYGIFVEILALKKMIFKAKKELIQINFSIYSEFFINVLF